MKILQYIWSLPRVYKRVVSLIIDSLFISLAYWAAYWARLGAIDSAHASCNTYVWAGNLVLTLFVFTKLGLYRAVLRYLTFHALLVIVGGALISMLGLTFISVYFGVFLPRSVPIIYMTFLIILCGGARLVVRELINQTYHKRSEQVIIYGAGNSGRSLSMTLKQSGALKVVAFIDDDTLLQGSIIQGVGVFSAKQLEGLISRKKVSKVLLALPRSNRSQRRRIINSLVNLPVEVLTVPSFTDIMSGKASIDELRDVPIEDLLGRDAVAPKQSLISANITGKVVMVTGAGGSIGSELCRQIIQQKPVLLVLMEVSEYALYQIDKELCNLSGTEGLDVHIVPLLGTVQKKHRLTEVMQSFKVQTVYHAAAYKHVPIVEYNVVEGVRNNVFGTLFAAQAAIDAGVESFVLISTDKAVRPTNVMGATKRIAELGLQALAAGGCKTRFCMVRFGNVLGSSGSVVPLFKKQIKLGGPITVTHPDIIRYFMTIPEAAQLVLQAGALGKGGDVFVLDMGEPVKITDLAQDLIHLSGLSVKSEVNPDGDIAIEYTGLRPGEKLFEELLIGDDIGKTPHERIMTASETFMPYDDYMVLIDRLDHACHNFDHRRIRQLLIDSPACFIPSDDIADLVWHAVENTA